VLGDEAIEIVAVNDITDPKTLAQLRPSQSPNHPTTQSPND